MKFLEGVNWIVVLGVIATIDQQIGSGSMSIAHTFPLPWQAGIKETMGNFGSIATAIMTAGAFGRVPAASIPLPPSVKSAIVLAFLVGVSLFGFAGDAHASGIVLDGERSILLAVMSAVIMVLITALVAVLLIGIAMGLQKMFHRLSARSGLAVIIIVLLTGIFAFAGDARAAQFPKPRPPAVTGDPVADIKTDLGITPATGVTKNSDGTVACNFNVFANLNPKNLIATVQACVSDANSTFEPDVAAALASAQSYNGGGSNGGTGDATAVQCLQPALAIVQAGIVRAAVVAVQAQPATPTTPAVPAVVAVPAYQPGPVTLFQKFREFVLAGGPSACQNWVNGTIQGAVAPVAGAVGAAAVGVATGGVIP